MTDDGDDGRTSVEEAETADEIRSAASRLEAASEDLTRGIDAAELAATAGVASAYRQEIQGLATRMSLFADELVDGGEPEETEGET